MNTRYLLFLAVFLFWSCQSDTNETNKTNGEINKPKPGSTQFDLLSPAQSGVQFKNQIKEDKEFHHLIWESVFYGGGVAIGDVNNDKLPDLYFTGNQIKDALYLNKGNMEFEDVSKKAGIGLTDSWSTGVTMVDINADGFLDIYVCKSSWGTDDQHKDKRRNELWINNGDLTFSEKAAEYKLDDPAHSTQATFFDYDRDGDLDMYLMNMPSNNFQQKIIYQQKNAIPYEFSDKLYKNLGKGKFADVTKEAGVENYDFGLGLTAADVNQDGWVDIYVACDYEKPDKLFINARNGTFVDRSANEFKHTSYSSMGCDLADFNNDGLTDIAVLDMQAADHKRSKKNMRAMNAKSFWKSVAQGYGYQYMSNALQMNNGYGFYSEIGQMAGIAKTDWSWSVLMADFDNDEYKDMFVTNGVNRDMRNSDLIDKMKNISPAKRQKTDLLKMAKSFPSEKLANYLFKNNGDLTFDNATTDWGLQKPGFSFGAAYGDLDADGDLDLVVCNSNEAAQIYRNSQSANYLQLQLTGNKINTNALGAKVYIHYDGRQQYQELSLTRGYQSSMEPLIHFGLGNVEQIDSVIIVFPNRKYVRLTDVKVNQKLEVKQADAKSKYVNASFAPIVAFNDVTQKSGINFLHRENKFNDFEREILLPHMQSKNGPFLTVGDVNNDGKEDFFVGGASGQAGALFLQKTGGGFAPAGAQPWGLDKEKEDMGVLFADLDGDKDLDLYVVSGGGEKETGAAVNQDRIYINDGKGIFSKASRLPESKGNGSCVVAADFDADGDLDLFVGSRGVPGKYPQGGASSLLVNTKDGFVDKSDIWFPTFKNIGMVTDAVATDFNKDGKQDLVIVGEWMAPRFYKNTGTEFLDVSNEMIKGDLTGWWFHVTGEDLDKDGDVDFVLGNIGLNNKFHPDSKKPLKIYAYDFDQNQSNDIVLAKNSEYGEVPVRGRECSSEQMPFIETKFKDFNSFANATINDIYGDNLEKATHIEAKEFRSGVLWNEGGTYVFRPFSNEVQLAPVQDCKIADVNKDGQLDLILVGNHFDSEVETVRYDAGSGLVLLGGESQSFDPVPVWGSRFYVPFNTKDMAIIPNYKGNKSLVLTANNNFRVMASEF